MRKRRSSFLARSSRRASRRRQMVTSPGHSLRSSRMRSSARSASSSSGTRARIRSALCRAASTLASRVTFTRSRRRSRSMPLVAIWLPADVLLIQALVQQLGVGRPLVGVAGQSLQIAHHRRVLGRHLVGAGAPLEGHRARAQLLLAHPAGIAQQPQPLLAGSAAPRRGRRWGRPARAIRAPSRTATAGGPSARSPGKAASASRRSARLRGRRARIFS